VFQTQVLESVPFHFGQQWNTSRNLLNLHPYFNDPFEKSLEVPLLRNIYDFVSVQQTTIFKNVSFDPSLMFPFPLNFFQSFTEIHADFYDPLGKILEKFPK